MKRRKYKNDPPALPSVEVGSYQELDVGTPIEHFPITGKVTRLKLDRASGTLIIDPDQPKDDLSEPRAGVEPPPIPQ
jgi:hypothetical protein